MGGLQIKFNVAVHSYVLRNESFIFQSLNMEKSTFDSAKCLSMISGIMAPIIIL